MTNKSIDNNLEIINRVDNFDDLHCHSTLSYCANSEMSLKKISNQLQQSKTCRKLAITDHGFAIYFPLEVVLEWQFMIDNGFLFEIHREYGNRKFAKHLQNIKKLNNPQLLTGVEVELMNSDQLTIDEKFLDQLDVIIGSVHWLEIAQKTTNKQYIFDAWWDNTQKLLAHNITVLGHPLRFLYSREIEPNQEQINALVKLAKENNVALELNSTGKNYHQDLPLLKAILKHDALLSLANDSHRLNTIGNFDYHQNCCVILGVQMNDFNILQL